MSRFDVVVIGAGITGCVSAAELAARGCRVLVVDKDDVAYEASGRNMGAVGVLGKHAAKLAGASIEKWDKAHESLPLPFEYHKMGRLCPAHSPRDEAVLREMRSTAKAHGGQIRLLSGQEVRVRFPELAPGIVSAAYSQDDALVEPIGATRAFAALAAERGVAFRAGVMAHRVTVRGSRVDGVELDSGEQVRADLVLIAAGVWTTRLLARLRIHVPMQFAAIYHGETQPMPATFDYFLRGPQYGARQLADGVVRVTGGYTALGAGHYVSLHDLRDLLIWLPRWIARRAEVSFRFDPRIVGGEVRSLAGGAPAPTRYSPPIPARLPRSKLAALQQVLPALAEARVVRTIAGVVDMTADALPVLGAVDRVPGLFVAAGFNGQGFGLGPVVGELLAQAMTGEPLSQSLDPYRWDRFKNRSQIPVPPRLV